MKFPELSTKQLAVVIVTVGVVLGVGGYGLWQLFDSGPRQTESQRVVREVGKLYLLPTGEEPTVARIQDVAKLTDQDFYKGAHNGDYLLVYRKGKLALIYRENQNILVRVGSVDLNT